MKSLYDLREEYKKILDLVDDDADLTDELNKIGDAIEKKIENLGLLIRTLNAQDQAVAAEITRLKKKSDQIGKSTDRLKIYIKETMEAVGLKSVRGTFSSATIQPSNPSCTITDEDLVPIAFKTAELKMPLDAVPDDLQEFIRLNTVNRQEILKLKEDGIDVPGTQITRGTHLVLR